MLSGTWSEVVLVREERIVLGSNSSQVRLMKVGEVCLLDQENLLSSNGNSMRHMSLTQSLKASASVSRKLVLFFFMRVSNHIEIAAKHPRSVQRRNNGLELIKESMSELWRSRGINICNVEGGISNGGGKVNGDGARSGKGSKVGKKRIRPSSKHAPRGAIGSRKGRTI